MRSMADRFILFWDTGEEVRASIVPVPLDEVLERLRERLLALPPGGTVRIDLIADSD